MSGKNTHSFLFHKKKKKIFRNKEQRPLRIILLFSSVVRHFFCSLFLSIRKCSISKKCKFGLRGMGHPPSTCHFLFFFFFVLFCFVLWLFFLFLSCGQIRIIPDFSSTVCPPFFFFSFLVGLSRKGRVVIRTCISFHTHGHNVFSIIVA